MRTNTAKAKLLEGKPAYGYALALGSPIAADGAFELEGLATGSYPATIRFSGKECSFTLDIPDGSSSIIELGRISCTGLAPPSSAAPKRAGGRPPAAARCRPWPAISRASASKTSGTSDGRATRAAAARSPRWSAAQPSRQLPGESAVARHDLPAGDDAFGIIVTGLHTPKAAAAKQDGFCCCCGCGKACRHGHYP